MLGAGLARAAENDWKIHRSELGLSFSARLVRIFRCDAVRMSPSQG